MKISQKGIDFICSYEGFSSTPYPDPGTRGEPYTIGYGTTTYPNGKKVTMQDNAITVDEGKMYIADHISHFETWLNSELPNLKQGQYDALCSFIYNTGQNAFASSTLLKDIKAGCSNELITAEFNKWVHGGGHVLPGLVKRRKAEAEIYCS